MDMTMPGCFRRRGGPLVRTRRMLHSREAATRASGGSARLGRVSSAGLLGAATRILRLRLFNGVASALLVIFNAAIAVWPMVALNVTLTAINVFYTVRLLRGRHDSRTFEVVEISPNEAYLSTYCTSSTLTFSTSTLDSPAMMPLTPISASSSSLERRRWAWSWRETQVPDQRRSTSITSCRDIRALR